MRPGNNSTTIGGAAHGGFWHWNSPVAYLFIGLALMLGLITAALIILACSYRKSLSNTSRDGVDEDDDQKPPKQVEIIEVDFEPKIVVIMAGDENPTYLAKPIVSCCSCNCPRDEQV